MSEDSGGLYDPRVREAMERFTGGGDTALFEAAAAVRSAFHAVERMRTQGAEGRGLSSGALDILIRVSDEAASIGDLAQAAGVSSRNVTGLVDTLEKDGLVRRDQDPQDRRSVQVSITPAGKAWTQAFRRPSQLAMESVFHGFTPDDLDRLRHLCLRLVQNQETR